MIKIKDIIENLELGKVYTDKDRPPFQAESVNESDLGLTLKKGKTITVTHKTSGKELVIIDKPNVIKKYEKLGFYAESINEAYKVHAKSKLGIGPKKWELEKFLTGGKSFDYKKGMEIVKKLRRMSSSIDYKLIKESVNEGNFSTEMVNKAVGIAFHYRDNMTKAVKAIEKMKKGLSKDKTVAYALQHANESLNEAPPEWSSQEARLHLDKDIGDMSKILGKASQQIIKIMMDGVKGSRYDAMDIQRGIETGPMNRTHEGERPFMKMLWRKVREGFRRYSPNKKLRK